MSTASTLTVIAYAPPRSEPRTFLVPALLLAVLAVILFDTYLLLSAVA